MSDNWWAYENLKSRYPYDWSPATRGSKVWDQLDFHLDLGSGRVRKGRMCIDHKLSPNVDLLIDLDLLMPADGYDDDATMDQTWDMFRIRAREEEAEEFRARGEEVPDELPGHMRSCLPFPDGSIESIITHHCLEHIGYGFEHLMEECYRVLKVGGVMRIVVPLFPSHSAVAEYDHRRYFLKNTFLGFCEDPSGARFTDGFAEPYNTCKFVIVDEDYSPQTPPEQMFEPGDDREMRIALWKHGGQTQLPDPFSLLPESAK